MTDIGKINVPHYAMAQEKTQQEEVCPNCAEATPEEKPVENTDLNKTPSAVLGQSMVKGPYKFDPKKVEADVLAFKGKMQAKSENYQFAKEFKKELQEEYTKEGMSDEQAEHLAEIAAQCLQNPSVYNR